MDNPRKPSGTILTTSPYVVLAILNHNGCEHLEYSLPTALEQDYSHVRVVVVDNASTDASLVWLEENFPQVSVVKLQQNVGYSAFNVFLQHEITQDAEYLLFLTNDIKLDPRCVSHAVEAISQDPHIGVIGFKMLGAIKWTDPEELEKASAAFKKPHLSDTDWVEGAAMMVHLGLLRALDGIDPVYFVYCDEDDLQARIRACGYKITKLNVPVWHNAGRNSLAVVPRRAAYLQMRNMIRYQIKNYGCLRGIKQAVRTALTACSPFVSIDRSLPYEVRQRPFGIFQNSIIVLQAWAWNFLQLPKTIRARQSSLRQIAQIRSQSTNPTLDS